MRPITLRMPDDLIAAYDRADGTRSALMRRRLAEAVENGEVDGVPPDLLVLAEREAEVDRGRLDRKRATFKTRCRDYFADKWSGGGVTVRDAEALARTWRREATLYGQEHLAFVNAVVEWYGENYDPLDRGEFPSAGRFVAESAPESVDLPARIVESLRHARDERDMTRSTAVAKLAKFNPREVVEHAADRVYGDENDRDETDEIKA